jgi:hypothetical protein
LQLAVVSDCPSLSFTLFLVILGFELRTSHLLHFLSSKSVWISWFRVAMTGDNPCCEQPNLLSAFSLSLLHTGFYL